MSAQRSYLAMILALGFGACSESGVNANDLAVSDGGAGDLYALPGRADGPAGCLDQIGGGVGSGVAGAGRCAYTCPANAIMVSASDDATTTTNTINNAAAGATVCIVGNHAITGTLTLKSNQTLIGIGNDARLRGSVSLTGWKSMAGATPVWYYDGPYAQTTQSTAKVVSMGTTEYDACYDFSVYQNDVFFNDKRMMRVLSTAQLDPTATLPSGQAVTAATFGRFYFDDTVTHRIYIDQDPTTASVELASVDTLVRGGNGVNNVTLQNLTLEKSLTTNLDMAGSGAGGGKSWTITDTTFRFAHVTGATLLGGLAANMPTTVTRTLFFNNGRYGLGPSGRYQVYEDCEISWNDILNYRAYAVPGTGPLPEIQRTCTNGFWGSGALKVANVNNGGSGLAMTFKNLESHHNVGPGLWGDVHAGNVLITGGHYHHNEWHGIDWEISCSAEITGAEIDNNGTSIMNPTIAAAAAAVRILNSNGVNVHDNIVHDNPMPVTLDYQPAHSGMTNTDSCPPAPGGDTDASQALLGNVIRNNKIYLCKGLSGWSSMRNPNESAPPAPLTANVWSGNAYHVNDPSTKTWSAGTGAAGQVGFSGWQGNGYDTAGSAVAPCTYP